MAEQPASLRIDKWLWAARFFKTRTLASRACELGRVRSNGQPVKPARDVRVGDLLQVKNDSGEFQIEILALSEMRGPAPVAQALYRETAASVNCAKRWPPSARPCRATKQRPPANHPSATAAKSSACA